MARGVWVAPTCIAVGLLACRELNPGYPGKILITTGLAKARGLRTDVIAVLGDEQTLLARGGAR